MKLHVIDGTYELYRSYYGAPKATNSDGREIGAARGLLRSLLALLREPDVTHVAIAFDHVIESFRNDLFDGYKTGEGIEPELWQQFGLAEDVARATGVVVWPMVEFEADDALATAAARWGHDPEVSRVFICSADKDLAQCVSGERIVLFDRMRSRIIDEQGVHEKWGVGPDSIPDLLALMGDSADGIPGIKRWGQKSSSTLLAEYESIEEIPEDPEEWSVEVRGAKGLAESLNANRDAALFYKTLTTLRTDVPLEESLADLQWRGAIREDLEPLAEEIAATDTLGRIKNWRP